MGVPDLADWDRLSADDQRRIAMTVSRSQPERFRFARLQDHELGAARHRLAHFLMEDGEFVLIPGGLAKLGFDPEDWNPTSLERASWEQTAAELGLTGNLQDYLRSVVSPPRTVRIAPCLVEVAMREVGWEPASDDDPHVRELLQPVELPDYLPESMRASIEKRMSRRPRTGGFFSTEEVLRVVHHANGSVQASRNVLRHHADVIRHIEQRGFRLPTFDEWEYFCGAGTRALFRWGDHVPCDRYPSDVSPEEARWRLQWVIADGDLDPPPEGFQPDWDLHLRPNAFGLVIATPQPGWELLHEPGRRRGGDGGNSICGGEGFFKGWLPLATAWCDALSCHRDPEDPIFPSIPVVRRVLSVE
jgi:hypothetical protein